VSVKQPFASYQVSMESIEMQGKKKKRITSRCHTLRLDLNI